MAPNFAFMLALRFALEFVLKRFLSSLDVVSASVSNPLTVEKPFLAYEPATLLTPSMAQLTHSFSALSSNSFFSSFLFLFLRFYVFFREAAPEGTTT